MTFLPHGDPSRDTNAMKDWAERVRKTNDEWWAKNYATPARPEFGFDELVRQIASDSAELLLSKHRDYGPSNIAGAPGGPLNGLRVRLYDKLARLNHLIETGADPMHESLIDTAVDITNYGLILQLVLLDEWPEA
jgi:hypothetical protein